MRIFCDYCQKPFEINEDELDDWITLDPSDGSQVVMCGQCESRPTQLTHDAGDSAVKMGFLTPEESAAIKADNTPAQRG